MAELNVSDAAVDPCCAPEQQARCCEPSAKAECCGRDAGCGCDAHAHAGPATPASEMREASGASRARPTP